MIEHNSSIPLYQQVFEDLKSKIRSNELEKGAKVSSERELCELYQVSRITVRQALDLLEKEGLIFTVAGIGTFIESKKIDQNLMRVTSFGKSLQQKDLIASTHILSYSEAVTSNPDAEPMGLGKSGNICRLDILGFADTIPIVYYQSYLRADIGRKMHEKALCMADKREAFSTFDLYEKIDYPIQHIDQRITAEAADAFVAEKLALPLGEAVLKLISFVYGVGNGQVEYKIGYYRSDWYAFSIKRSV